MSSHKAAASEFDIDTMRSDGALSKSVAHFARPKGADLLERTRRFESWRKGRERHRVYPYDRALQSATGPYATISYSDGHQAQGLNFASQDYLGLSVHTSIREAASDAIEEYGVHSAGSAILLGNTHQSLQLEQDLAEFLDMEHVMLFPTGWGAGFGTLAGLVRQHDYIVMDELAHACLQQGAAAATSKVLRYRHNEPGSLRAALQEIRGRDARSGILAVTEGLFSMDSDVPDLDAFQTACTDYGATSFVDVAHDLGAMGPGGTGSLGRQNLLAKVDLVMGSFSKTFASNGGFLATNQESVKQFVKTYGGPHIFSNALSPVQCAAVREALRIVRSDEGEQLRGQLMSAVNRLRQEFSAHGVEVIGEPSAIVPAVAGNEAAGRVAARLLYERNVFANLVEFPAIAAGTSRFRLQVMATHSDEQVMQAAEIVSAAITEGQRLTG